jgi:hypothetical protein
MKQFQVNKWWRLASTFLIGLIGLALSVDWTQYFNPPTAGKIIIAFTIVKAVYESFAPSSDTTTVPTPDSYVISHKTIEPVEPIGLHTHRIDS